MAVALVACTGAVAETIRIATFSPDLSRKGPGLLLRDILGSGDDQIAAVISVIAANRPDILLLTGVDYDAGHIALNALAERLKVAGVDYPHRFSLRPNTGIATGLDMDGNGRTGEPRDAQGYGRFAGQAGMALLSRFPILTDGVKDLSGLLWRDIPGAQLPMLDGTPLPSAEAQAVQRLATTGHWVVPIDWPGPHPLTLLAFSATPPVFDGPEDRNGLRNAEEVRMWQRLLDGDPPLAAPQTPFVILGDANLDPADGDGRREAMAALLRDPRLKDPRPSSPGAKAESDPEHSGDPALDTVDWTPAAEGGPGNLRVDYVLPSKGLSIVGNGVYWPSGGPGLEAARSASRHRLVWIDLEANR